MITQNRLIKSYVWHGEQCYFVSTIWRESPARYYAETIAWEHDWVADERGKQVAMEGEGEAFEQHVEMCRQLFETGRYEEPTQ